MIKTRKIIKEHLIDPAFFEKMSKLLDEIIKERKAEAISYAEYLEKIAALTKKVNEGKSEDVPTTLVTIAQRALYNNLGNNEALAMQIDSIVKSVKKPVTVKIRSGWDSDTINAVEVAKNIEHR